MTQPRIITRRAFLRGTAAAVAGATVIAPWRRSDVILPLPLPYAMPSIELTMLAQLMDDMWRFKPTFIWQPSP